MKVICTETFTDEERAGITIYMREQYGRKGLPRLATRAMLREWVTDAIGAHWIDVEDVIAGIEERKRPT